MKKISRIAILFLMTFAILLTGCTAGKKLPDVKVKDDTKKEETKEKKEKKKKDSSDKDDKDRTKKEKTSGVNVPMVCHHYDYAYDPGTYKTTAYVRFDTLTLGDLKDTYPKMEKVLNNSLPTEKSMKEELQNLEDSAKEESESMGYDMVFYDVQHSYIRRSDDKIFSYISSSSTFSGGAHGYYGFGGYNYNINTGEEIEFDDVVKDDALLKKELVKRLEREYPDIDFFDSGDDIFANYDGTEQGYEFNFVLEPYGVTFIFNPYEIAAYAYGVQFITIGYDEVPGLFDDSFSESKGSYCQAFEPYLPFLVTDKDGNTTKVNVSEELDYMDDTYTDSYLKKITFEIDGEQYSDDECAAIYSYGREYYLVHMEDGSNFVYCVSLHDNDWHEISVYEIEDNGEVSFIDDMEGEFYKTSDWDNEDDKWIYSPAIIDPAHFEVINRCNVLSTYSTVREYHIGEDGMPNEEQDYYTSISEMVITSAMDLELTYLGTTEETGLDAPEVDGTGEKRTVPEGTDFLLWRTDGSTYVDAIVEKDGEKEVYRIEFTKDPETFEERINGDIDAYDAFVALYYAG